MTIPDFAASGVLPPYVGEPARGRRSPYPATVHDVVYRFATSDARCEILRGWLKHRAELHKVGFVGGFQWLNGSFCEDLTSAGREPRDIDVVTFFALPPGATDDFADDLALRRPELFLTSQTKQRYSVDAYFVQLTGADTARVAAVHYWYGLFSHRRGDETWKGMVQVSLSPTDDRKALRAVKVAQAQLAAKAQTP